MANIPLDSNNRPAIGCASSVDGKTIVPIKAGASDHSLLVEDGSSGTDNGNNGGQAMLDENGNSVWIAESSAGDGTIIEVYGDASTGAVLVKSI